MAAKSVSIGERLGYQKEAIEERQERVRNLSAMISLVAA
jgi:hypothetical protein